MAFVNKRSLREELDTLKEQYTKLSSEGKVPRECNILFQGMLMLFEVLMAIFMEKVTHKNNKNSSKPSSQTQKDETSTGNKGSNSKGLKQKDIRSDNTRTVETTRIAKVKTCNNCGKDLNDIASEQFERRTMIDIIFEKQVTHVDAEIKHCPKCNATTKATFPSNMPGPLQYGTGIKAYILNLLIAQMISLKRIQKLITTMIGNIISEATILKYVIQLYIALEDWEKSTTKKLLSMRAINVDETSMKVNKKNHYIHSYSSGEITLKFLHKGRGKEAINDIGIIPSYKGVIIHDCLPAYFSYTHCTHGLCGSHLLRELQFVIESNNYTWAKKMKKLLKEICARVSKSKRKKLSELQYKKIQRRYRNILSRGIKELPPIPKKQKGKRGKIAKSDAHNLWERLKDKEKYVLLFARNSDVPFTNNRAERDLRMSKVKQKVSGCFRKELFAKAYCRISSYLQTMSNMGYNPLVAIQMAFSAQIYLKAGE